MKTYSKIIIIVSILCFALNSNAQLKVKTDGSVKIGSQSPYPSGGKLEITGVNETLECKIVPSFSKYFQILSGQFCLCFWFWN